MFCNRLNRLLQTIKKRSLVDFRLVCEKNSIIHLRSKQRLSSILVHNEWCRMLDWSKPKKGHFFSST